MVSSPLTVHRTENFAGFSPFRGGRGGVRDPPPQASHMSLSPPLEFRAVQIQPGQKNSPPPSVPASSSPPPSAQFSQVGDKLVITVPFVLKARGQSSPWACHLSPAGYFEVAASTQCSRPRSTLAMFFGEIDRHQLFTAPQLSQALGFRPHPAPSGNCQFLEHCNLWTCPPPPVCFPPFMQTWPL